MAKERGIKVRDNVLEFAMSHYESLGRSKTRDLRRRRWNGRQIRNAFQTAIALARNEAEKKRDDGSTAVQAGAEKGIVLTRRHFEEVAQASWAFDSYLVTTRGIDPGIEARENGLRADDFHKRDEPPFMKIKRSKGSKSRERKKRRDETESEQDSSSEAEEHDSDDEDSDGRASDAAEKSNSSDTSDGDDDSGDTGAEDEEERESEHRKKKRKDELKSRTRKKRASR